VKTTGSFPLNPYGHNQSEDAMNRYGVQAMSHWQEIDPDRYATIPDPETFFTALGTEVEQEIDELAMALAGKDRPGEDYLQKVGRLNMARFTAESDVLREMVLIPDPHQSEIDERPADDLVSRGRAAMQQVLWEEDQDL
jgi:hypothetical protein